MAPTRPASNETGLGVSGSRDGAHIPVINPSTQFARELVGVIDQVRATCDLFDELAKKEQKRMAAIEAFRRGDEVCTKASGGPIMTVLAVEGLKVRCADGENLQYWFDTAMLERYKQSQRHSEVSSVAIYESVNADGLEPSNARQSYLRCETFADETIMDGRVELRSDFWVYVEQLLRTPQTLAA